MIKKISRAALDFNKEILFGELGAITGAQVFGYISSKSGSSHSLTTILVVAGAMIGSAAFYLASRFYHQKKAKEFSINKFRTDLLYFTPVALTLTIGIYYPSLYFLEKYFLEKIHTIILSTFLAQTLAFVFFLTGINIYRIILLKSFKRKL